ncbi:coiled-coil domain-containing protein 42 like-2-like isoform X1 [Platichthys flesus]|uniref:coiled-coil domain-containing protein 42 like-2-like isoform X1 n=2 Tax=Platichthys flesus TaxID=8260 RepID=UPI001A81F090|nr:coiled-coil domain-containing protein 42 like-2-like isoform X1 [Platichthys flesus]
MSHEFKGVMSLSKHTSDQQLSCPVMTRALDRSAAIVELLSKRREDEQLKVEIQEREGKSESLQKRIDELQTDHRKAQELHLSFDMFLKEADVNKTVEKAERERREALQKGKQIETLKKEKAELMQKKHKLDHQVQRHTVYRDIMEQMVAMTKFKDAELLADNLESQLHLREQLCQREREAEEQVELHRKALAALDNQQDLMQLQRSNQLSQLQARLDETNSGALIWERKWNTIQETAAKKILLLGQMKMATLNLYEATGGKIEGEEGVGMNDTEKQLDKIRMFIQDHQDIVKLHQTPSQTQRWTEPKSQKVPFSPLG